MSRGERLARAARLAAAACWTLGVALCASVAASQILLGLAALAAPLALRGSGERIAPPPGTLPLALFAGWSVLSALLSPVPLYSLWHSKELLLLGVPLLGTLVLVGTREAERTAGAALAGGALLALWGIAQYLRGLPSPYVRISGPLSHHLTYAGIIMLLFVAAAAWSGSVSPALRGTALASLAPLAGALLLNQSRSAWLGATAGLAVLAAFGPRRVALGLLLSAALAIASVPQLRERAVSLADPASDTSFLARRAMLRTGARILAEHPWFGTGPGGIEEAYARLQPPEYPLPRVGHLHCTPLQVAAERGLPAVLVWSGYWVALARGLLGSSSGASHASRQALRSAAAACCAAFLVMGLFEYNFGDAEPSTLLLGLLALPFVRGREEPRASGGA